jgi:hypothetical protein
MVILTGELNASTTSGSAYMSVSVDGGTALDTNSLRVTGASPVRASVVSLITQTPGSHTFTAVGKLSGSGTATFNARTITVLPM